MNKEYFHLLEFIVFHISYNEKNAPIKRPTINPYGLIEKYLSAWLPSHPNNNNNTVIWIPTEERVSQLLF